MTQADDWEPVKYRDLPNWMKEASKPQRAIRKNHKTIFHGDPYDYMVQYNVDEDTLTLSYWRAAHTVKGVKKPQKKFSLPSPRLLYGVIIFIGAAAGLVFLSHFLPLISIPPLDIPFPATSSEVPNLSSTSPITQSLTSVTTPVPVTNYLQSPKNTSFPYSIDGNRRSLSFTTYGGLADFFSSKTHSFHYDPETGVFVDLLEDEDQNEHLKPFIEMIRKRSTTPDNQARIAISLVQRIPYNGNRYTRAATDWYYPYETLYNNRGSAADKSVLLAYILNELGYDTVLFEFSNHMAVGVKSSSKFAFYGTGYAYIETTQPTIITYEPDSSNSGFVLSQNPRIIHLSGGRRTMDVNPEYNDALRMKQLEEKGGNLNQSYRAELAKISEKYDLDSMT